MATTAPAVLDRVNTIVASAPYSYQRAISAFGVDAQPNSSVNRTYFVGMELDITEGNIGYTHEERWLVRIGLAQARADDDHAAQRALATDIHSMVATLSRESSTEEHHFEDGEFTGQVFEPDAADAYVVAELIGAVNFERAL